MQKIDNDSDEVPEYSNHKSQLEKSQPDGERVAKLEEALLAAFDGFLEYRRVAYICFGDLNAKELSIAFQKYPIVVKATLSCVNVAQRAIARDLGVTFDTYAEKISPENAALLAGYIKPLLPPAIALPALMELDRYSWADKELRAGKGNWEKKILRQLCHSTGAPFLKRKFEVQATPESKIEAFELDAAYEISGRIEVGIDIKRIESPRDIHKRADEIVNKATKFKIVYPNGKFLAVVYYPFPNQHINVLSRLESKQIDDVFFAGESDSSIESAVEMLAGKIALKKKTIKDEPKILVSAKRKKTERQGMHAWHPYYAGYSEAFVESALKYLSCDSTTLVLDPWCGSGTTNVISSRLGVESIGIDINPAMTTFSAAKSYEVLKSSNEILQFLEGIRESKTTAATGLWPEDPLLDVFSPEATKSVRWIMESIPFSSSLDVSEEHDPSEFSELISKTSVDKSRLLSPAYSFIVSALFRSLRAELMPGKSSNPTWSKLAVEKHHIDRKQLVELLLDTAKKMLFDLEQFYSKTGLSASYAIASGDCKSLPIRSSSIDRVITSPPYLTRIDYAISTQLEISTLTDKNTLSFVRHSTMGAPVITKAPKNQDPKWGKICNNILSNVKKHETKAAATYYWKNMVQYFGDVHEALKEINRVLKVGGSGLIVVQGSYFKDIEIPLGEIYVDMAEEVGLRASIVHREVVKGHMAHVNTKSTAYMADKVYHEDFVKISKF